MTAPSIAVPATLSPCGTLATVTCPRCGSTHVHGWSGDPDFDARPRPPLCHPERVRSRNEYVITIRSNS